MDNQNALNNFLDHMHIFVLFSAICCICAFNLIVHSRKTEFDHFRKQIMSVKSTITFAGFMIVSLIIAITGFAGMCGLETREMRFAVDLLQKYSRLNEIIVIIMSYLFIGVMYSFLVFKYDICKVLFDHADCFYMKNSSVDRNNHFINPDPITTNNFLNCDNHSDFYYLNDDHHPIMLVPKFSPHIKYLCYIVVFYPLHFINYVSTDMVSNMYCYFVKSLSWVYDVIADCVSKSAAEISRHYFSNRK